MQAVVADTGPLNYLALIGRAEIFPQLFGTVFVPEAVRMELSRPKAPLFVRQWIASPPSWLVVRQRDLAGWDAGLLSVDEGERDAIMLAVSIEANLILMDDQAGVAAARARGFTVFGTVGLLDLAARRGLLELEDAFMRLRTTNFHIRPELLDTVLANFKKESRE